MDRLPIGRLGAQGDRPGTMGRPGALSREAFQSEGKQGGSRFNAAVVAREGQRAGRVVIDEVNGGIRAVVSVVRILLWLGMPPRDGGAGRLFLSPSVGSVFAVGPRFLRFCAARLGARGVIAGAMLSLIHISEPTRRPG